MRQLALCAAAALLLSAGAALTRAQDALTRVHRDGDQIIFIVSLARPADVDDLAIEQARAFRTPPAWPRIPDLRSDPPWKYAAYFEDITRLDDNNRWSGLPPIDQFTFIGRGPAADSVTLTYRYPLKDGGWREAPLTLDLKSAAEVPPDSDPRERWAAAQAATLAFLADALDDPGGFYSFAQQQTTWKYESKPPLTPRPFVRRERAEIEERMYDLTTGALAVQESLQLDRMTNVDRQEESATIEVAKIPAVAVKSHPFDEMRGAKEPRGSLLAELAPADNYFATFTSVAKLLELVDLVEQWGGSLLRLADVPNANFNLVDRTLAQLHLTRDALKQLAADAIVGEIAITGSDPYVQMGSDVTVLFEVRQRERFEQIIEPLVQDPKLEQPLRQAWIEHGGKTIYVTSNSAKALTRTLPGNKPSRLSEEADYKYMRAAVFPRDPAEEDGFIFLSDAFIRRLVGPELRIKQKRRLEALTSLRLITNAALFYGYEHGPAQPTLAEIFTDRALDPKALFDPQGGTFDWDARAQRATSSFWGEAQSMKPLLEVPLEMVTAKERAQYEEFRDRYEEYWRTFFDPIGVRLKIDKTVRVQVHILPLINNSSYDQLTDIAGGDPIAMPLDRTPPQTLLRFMLKIAEGRQRAEVERIVGGLTNSTSDWFGDWVTFWIEDSESLATLLRNAYRRADGEEMDDDRHEREVLDFFNSTFVLGVHVKNKLSLAAFLVALRTLIDTSAPNTVAYHNLEPHNGVTIVQIAPVPGGELSGMLGEDDQPTTQPSTAPIERAPAIYYAIIGNAFYLSTQASALRRLIDLEARPADPAANARLRDMRANALLYASPSAADAVRSAVSYVFERQLRNATLRNLKHVWTLGRCGVLQEQPIDQAAQRYFGFAFARPAGDEYTFDAARLDAISSVYGPLTSPRRLDGLPKQTGIAALLDTVRTVTAALKFTDHGVETTVDIERK